MIIIDNHIMKSRVPPVRFRPHESRHRQIADHLRDSILRGKLPPGAALGSTHVLARQWHTSYGTTHLALSALVRAGLLKRRQGLGTFVAADRLQTIGVYAGEEHLLRTEPSFIRSLHSALQVLLAKEKIQSRVFVDARAGETRTTPTADLRQAVQAREFQCLIALGCGPRTFSWLDALPVPVVFWGTAKPVNSVGEDWQQLLRISLEELARQGCSRVGLIVPFDVKSIRGDRENPRAPFLEILFETVRGLGMDTCEDWVCVPIQRVGSQPGYGYAEFKRLWGRSERPNGLVVWPDTVAQGTLAAILEARVRVPEELRLILHRSITLEYFSPVPVTWLETNVAEAAAALVRQAKELFRGRAAERFLLPYHLRPNADPRGAGGEPSAVAWEGGDWLVGLPTSVIAGPKFRERSAS